MCLVLLALDRVPGYPVVLAANRDERHERPADPLHRWAERPEIVGGRDRVAGGTWLAVRRDGHFATVLNAPGRPPPSGAASRGELVPRVLTAEDPESAVEAVVASASAYAGFHLLAGRPGGAWYLGADGAATVPLAAGIHGIDNAGLDIDDPRLSRASGGFAGAAAQGIDALLALLGDAADPGPGTGDCRSIFIRDPVFGTRCSTVLRIGDDDRVELFERRFDADGAATGETHLGWSLEPVGAGSG